MRRSGLAVSLALALLLLTAPGAFASPCTAVKGGTWTDTSTWSCGAVPTNSDAATIPAGITVTIAAGGSAGSASLTLGGTLALGDANSSLDTSAFAANGGTISSSGPLPAGAQVTVTLGPAVNATVGTGGLTVNGADLAVTGGGALAIAGPLAITNGGWFESDVGTSWTSTAPWRLGGADAAQTSTFEVVGAQFTILAATSAQRVPGAGGAAIKLDTGATLSKQDATTTTLGVDVVLDDALLQVIAGKVIGGLQGNGALSLSAGALLGFSGSGDQLTSNAVNVTGGTFEVEPGASVSLALPENPNLRLLHVASGASLDVTIATAPPDMLSDTTTLDAGAKLSMDGGAGTLSLADHELLSGSGTLDGTLRNTAGIVAPSGTLDVTGDFSQAAAGTFSLALGSAADGDALTVAGSAALAGALNVTTSYTPAASAALLVLGSARAPSGTFAKVSAPVGSARAWSPVYSAKGVVLSLGGAGVAGAGAALARPQVRPKALVVGATARCVPGTAKGGPALTYHWLRAGKVIRGATKARYLVRGSDRGRRLACRVTAAAGGATATSVRALARTGLTITAAVEHGGKSATVSVRCAAIERLCHGSLRIFAAGHAVAGNAFAVHAPGGGVHLNRLGTAPLAAGTVVVRATYRNGAGALRHVTRRLELTL